MTGKAEWACSSTKVFSFATEFEKWSRVTSKMPGGEHWSRKYEYPWVMIHGDFYRDQWVLDAAGGDGGFQYMACALGCRVLNVDFQHDRSQRSENLLTMKGDIGDLPFTDESFDRVVCISVLEHTDDPLKILRELLRVIKKGGRLLLTLDVANYARYNHKVDDKLAREILGELGLEVPDLPENHLRLFIKEQDNKPDEPDNVLITVLCLYVDKP
jgi:ubiquinone/menaquinone biosynthesis C-methylase UbiE